MAHGLNIALSGPRSYGGEIRDYPFVNDAGEHALTSAHIDQSIAVLWKTWGLALVIAAGLFLFSF
jgi:adenosylcobinamide-phosphate synthase